MGKKEIILSKCVEAVLTEQLVCVDWELLILSK